MKIKPLYDKVLIKREEALEKTAGGIIIPDTSKEKPSKGTVISVGEGARNEKGDLIPMILKTGILPTFPLEVLVGATVLIFTAKLIFREQKKDLD